MADEKKTEEYCKKFEDHKFKNLMSYEEFEGADVKHTVKWCEICGCAAIGTSIDGDRPAMDKCFKPKIFQDWRKANGVLPGKLNSEPPK